MCDKHQKSDNLSKMTNFQDRLEQRKANQTEIRKRFSLIERHIRGTSASFDESVEKDRASNAGIP